MSLKVNRVTFEMQSATILRKSSSSRSQFIQKNTIGINAVASSGNKKIGTAVASSSMTSLSSRKLVNKPVVNGGLNKILPKARIPGTKRHMDYVRLRSSASMECNKLALDHPEVIKDKAKKLVSNLERRAIFLNDAAIERIIKGDPNEFLQAFKKIFASYENTMAAIMDSSSCCHTTSRIYNTHCDYKELVTKLDGKLNGAAVALLSVISQALELKPVLSPGQFLQPNKFVLPKLSLCNEVMNRLSIISRRRLSII